MKNILLISHSLQITGAPLSLFNIATILNHAKYNVTVWSLKDGPLSKTYKEKLNVNVKVISKDIKEDYNYLSESISKFDFVIVNTVVCDFFANICQNINVPYMWVIRESKNIKQFIRNLDYTKKCFKNCEKHVYAVSEYAQNYFKQEFGVNTQVIHNFVEDEYNNQKIPSQKNKINFTIVGTVEERKGIHILIDALYQMPKEYQNRYQLNILGEYLKGYTAFSKPLRIKTQDLSNIKWCGNITGTERQKLFEQTDVFVVPSLDEASSRVVLEACMMGRPVIVSENVGAKYMVNENTGWIVKTGDVESLKNCIENIINNPECLPKMGLAAREMYLNTSTPEIYKEKLEKIINEKIQNKKDNKIGQLLNKLYSVNYLQTHKVSYFLGIKIKQKYIQEQSLLEKIFSVKNRDIHKIITICGLKIKLKNTKSIEKKYCKQQEVIEKQKKKIEQLSKALTLRNKNDLEFKTFQQLTNTIRKNLYKLPSDIDIVVGIPRSGIIPAYIIALFLNKNVCSINEFVNNLLPQKGERAINENPQKEKKKILIVDDSINTGNALSKVKEQLNSIDQSKYNIEYCCIYSIEESKNKVDYYFEIVEQPRVFQWNYLNHNFAKQCCYDIDGVLCVDPTEEENDDGEKYINFILNAKPLYIPTYTINSIVTSRLEKYRAQTEEWLRQHNVKYKNLYMLDLPSAEERRRLNCHADFKAKVFSNLENCKYFIESNRNQAIKIAELTGKQCICVETDECFGG